MTPGCREMVAEALRHVGEALDLVMACAKDEHEGGEPWAAMKMDWAAKSLMSARADLRGVSAQ